MTLERPHLSYELSTRIIQRPEFSHEPVRFGLLSKVEKFDTVYGFVGSAEEFAEKLDREIADDPDLVYPFVFTGLPGSGKSVLTWQVLNYILNRKDSETAKRIKKDKYNVRVDILPWGDAFNYFPEGKTPNSDLSPKRLQAQLNKASYIYGNTIQKVFEGYYYDPKSVLHIDNPEFETIDGKKKYIRIVALEVPTKAGIILKGHSKQLGLNYDHPDGFNEWDQLDDEEKLENKQHREKWGEAIYLQKIGFLRARVLLRDLAGQKGMFKGYKGLYKSPSFVDVVASNDVRRVAMLNRIRLNVLRMKYGDSGRISQEDEKILKDTKMNLKLSGRRIGEYGEEDAILSDIRQIDNSASDVAFALFNTGELSFDEFSIFGPYAPFNSPSVLKAFPVDKSRGVEIRAKILGEDVMPWFFINEVGIEPEYARDNVIGLYNKEQTEVTVEDIPGQHFPVREIYNEIERRKRIQRLAS